MRSDRYYYILVFILIVGAASLGVRTRQEHPGVERLANESVLGEGWHDPGDCQGEGLATCYLEDALGTPAVGCMQEALECESGWAAAMAHQPGKGLCVQSWWRWECQPAGFVAQPNAGDTLAQWTAQGEPERIVQWRAERSKNDQMEKEQYGKAYAESMPVNPCALPEGFDASNARVVMLSAYQGGKDTTIPHWWLNAARVDVKDDNATTKDGVPVILVLSAYNPVEWHIEKNVQNVVAVIMTGYEPQRITGIDPSIPVLMSDYHMMHEPEYKRAGQCTAFEYLEAQEPEEYPAADAAVKQLLGRGIDRIIGEYAPGSLIIPAVDWQAGQK